ncbi:MAG: 2'-deoxycytidine 5'-triphosphate deaminase [Bdellovibrionales bacterium]
MAKPHAVAAATSAAPATAGILPYQALHRLIAEGQIAGDPAIGENQIQPASIDLRLGGKAWRVRASFLPGPETTVMDKIRQLDGYAIDIADGAVLEKGCVYVIPLLETLKLADDLVGLANPKSSIGRLDVLTRLIADRSTAFDQVERGYKGPLYVEVAPRTFSIVVRKGSRLNQIRFRRGTQAVLSSGALEQLIDEGRLVSDEESRVSIKERNLLPVTIDLQGSGPGSLIGYRAKKHTDRIDIEKIGHYDPLDFWEPIRFDRSPSLTLDPNDFYILATRETIRVPPEYAAEMLAYETTVGEFRVHYAGFFDPGFGWDIPNPVNKAVLEVRSHEVPFMLEHAQTIGWLRYERIAGGRPERLYGAGIGSNYQNQGLQLAKQFRTA